MPARDTVLVTGATGLLGRDVLARLLSDGSNRRYVVFARDAGRAAAMLSRIAGADQATVVQGDLESDALGLSDDVRARLCASVTSIIHLGADTTFSRPLVDARAVNTTGTLRLLELAAECTGPVRFAFVSTAFVAGRRTGRVAEDAGTPDAGWVNAYEQSKWEAEALVRAHAASWTILRPSTVVCDDAGGTVTQFNASHRALRLYRDGLAAMMPGVDGATVDTVTTEYVGRAIAALALCDDALGQTFHLCAGDRAIPLTELLDVTYDRWADDPEWRRRAIMRPALADLRTYALFERTIEETADASLKRVTRALSHFVPQLALPKWFETARADAMLGFAAPEPLSYWRAMVDYLVATRWGAERWAA